MKEFDLQLFAEKTDASETETTATETAPAAESPEDIPEELAGLPEDIARETMREASTPESTAKSARRIWTAQRRCSSAA